MGETPARHNVGATAHTRPYENYYAQVMRIAYPEMDMGRELLRLNLGMYAILELRHTQITGEMRQASLRRCYAFPLGNTSHQERIATHRRGRAHDLRAARCAAALLQPSAHQRRAAASDQGGRGGGAALGESRGEQGQARASGGWREPRGLPR